jgi:hypothetical protein
MQPEERFARIEALLSETSAEADRCHRLAMERMDRAERESTAKHKAAMDRMNLAEQRMQKFDLRLEATRKLVEAGMKIVVRNNIELRELKQAQKAFLDSLRKGSNGHRR